MKETLIVLQIVLVAVETINVLMGIHRTRMILKSQVLLEENTRITKRIGNVVTHEQPKLD